MNDPEVAYIFVCAVLTKVPGTDVVAVPPAIALLTGLILIVPAVETTTARPLAAVPGSLAMTFTRSLNAVAIYSGVEANVLIWVDSAAAVSAVDPAQLTVAPRISTPATLIDVTCPPLAPLTTVK